MQAPFMSCNTILQTDCSDFFSQKLKFKTVDRAPLGIISGMDVSDKSVILGLASLNEPLPGKRSCCVLSLPSTVSSIKSLSRWL